VEESTAAWLAFVDADVRVSSGTIVAAATVAEKEGVPASCLLGRQDGWLEFDAGLLVMRRACDVRAVNAGRETYLIGQCVVVRRDELDAVGGWASVKGSMVEDVDLGERLGRHRIFNAVGRMEVARRQGARASWRKNMWRTHGGGAGLATEAAHFGVVLLMPWFGGLLSGLSVYGLVALGRLGARLSARRPFARSLLEALAWPAADAALLGVFAESVAWHAARVSPPSRLDP
jgi:hypothetical protein